MDTKPYSLQAPEEIAKEYGGNKRAIAQAAQQGLVNPTAAVLAGMFIDRMRNAASQEQETDSSVFQDTFNPQMAQAPMGGQAMPQGQMGVPGQAMPQGQMGVPSQPTVMAASGGLMSLPVDDSMFDEGAYAGGGIVAFRDGGPSVPTMLPEGMRRQESPVVLRAYYMSRGLPIPPELMTEAEKAKASRAPYPAGIFPKIGRFASDIGESIGNFVSPGGAGFYSQDEFSVAQPDVSQPSTSKPAGLGAITTVSDVNAMPSNIDRQLRAMPGLTPEQSSANIATARPSAPAGEGPSGTAGLNVDDIIARSGKMARGIIPADTTPVPSMVQAGQEVSDLLKQSGFDEELLKKQRGELETEKAGLAEDRKTAQNMRLIEAGLGIMAGESPNAFVNIGKGATPALQGLAKDIKEIKAAERSYNQAQRDLDNKQNDFALGKAGMTQRVIDKAQQRVDERAREFRELQGGIAKTLLSGDIQSKLLASRGAADTDFARKWKLYTEGLKPGEKPTPEGYMKVWGRSDNASELQLMRLALDASNAGMSLAELRGMATGSSGSAGGGGGGAKFLGFE